MGDFNAVMGSHEKSGGISPYAPSCNDFNGFIEEHCMIEMSPSNSAYTWSNGRIDESHIEAKLDRCFVSLH